MEVTAAEAIAKIREFQAKGEVWLCINYIRESPSVMKDPQVRDQLQDFFVPLMGSKLPYFRMKCYKPEEIVNIEVWNSLLKLHDFELDFDTTSIVSGSKNKIRHALDLSLNLSFDCKTGMIRAEKTYWVKTPEGTLPGGEETVWGATFFMHPSFASALPWTMRDPFPEEDRPVIIIKDKDVLHVMSTLGINKKGYDTVLYYMRRGAPIF